MLVITGTRSEFGILEPVCRAIAAHPDLELRLAVTGVHLLRRYGHTVDDVVRSGLPVDYRVSCYDEGPIDEEVLPRAIGRGVAGLGDAMRAAEADVVVVLGDRAEALAGAVAAYSSGRCVAHLHGGEKTDSGTLDEGFRHAITRLAHLHFVATEAAAARLIAHGEEPQRVHLVGAPGLDNVFEFVRRWRQLGVETSAAAFRERQGFAPGQPTGVLLLHPDRWHRGEAGALTAAALESLLGNDLGVIAIHPNGDPGSEEIMAAIETVRARSPGRVRVHASLPREEFHAALASAAVLVGNSSAGAIEAPVVGVPVVNVGDRNREREHGRGVEFVAAEGRAIDAAIRRALVEPWRLGPHPGPYGDGTASGRIADVLARWVRDAVTLGKRVTA
ncbi:MAG: UDP-N-acetylglucosamine 2-epimerase [Planctomycetota bacterium]